MSCISPTTQNVEDVEIHNEDMKIMINGKNGLLRGILNNIDFDNSPSGEQVAMSFTRYTTKGR